MNYLKKCLFGLVLNVALLAPNTQAEVIFFDDFQDGQADGWQALGKGDVRLSSYKKNVSLHLSHSAIVVTSFSTKGYEKVTASLSFAAKSLEEGEYCIGEITGDAGQSWHEINKIGDGQDDAVTLYSGSVSSQELNDNEKVYLRVRVSGNKDNDKCWLDNVRVIGRKITSSDKNLSSQQDFERKILWNEEEMKQPLDMSFFAGPESTSLPKNTFRGRLRFQGPLKRGGFNILKDDYQYDSEKSNNRRQLPPFDFEYIQSGNDIIPLERGLIEGQHSKWNYILEPGIVWNLSAKNGFSRASIPFSLQEKNANCTHNGVMTFSFRNDGKMSHVALQIVSETCLYFKFDMWGLYDATYIPAPISQGSETIKAFKKEVSTRMPVKSIGELAKDFPTVKVKNIGAADEVSPDHMTAFGLIVNGFHYTGGCETRFGTYPFCDVMSLPSYSTAKSVFGGLVLMRLELLYPGIKRAKISDYIPACEKTGEWEDVSFQDALNMTTGHYNSDDYMAEEGSAEMIRFFDAKNHADKIKIACTAFARKSSPGKKWVYRTADTYILGTALQNFLIEKRGAGVDIYRDILADPLWKNMGLSPLLNTTVRSTGNRKQPLTGYGLTYHRDDIARISDYLNNSPHGKNSFFDKDEFNKAMQRDPKNRGITITRNKTKYSNGFWASNFQSILNCKEPLWVPFMSGFGGITIAMLPNGITYYYVSDNNDFAWRKAVLEAHKIKNMCLK